jgi:CubicO group peptidase (beta-lactamase class C family)
MARFGLLFLREGNWNGRQIIPAGWVRESTTAYSQDPRRPRTGYGYLWWTNYFDVPVPHFTASGAFAKYISVIPSLDLVFVYQSHTEFPDRASAMSAEDLNRMPSATGQQVSKLLELLLLAQQK